MDTGRLPKVRLRGSEPAGPGFLNQALDIGLGTLETPASLITGMAAWPVSKLAGGASLVGSMLLGDTPQQTDEIVRGVEESVASALTYPPRSRSGQASVDAVGHTIEKALDIPLTLGNVKGELYKPLGLKNITEVDPRLGWGAGLATELAAFAGVHGLGKGAKAKIKKWQAKNQREGWKANAEIAQEKAGEMLDDFRSIQKELAKAESIDKAGDAKYQARFAKIKNQLDATVKAIEDYEVQQFLDKQKPDAVGSHGKPQQARAPQAVSPEQRGARVDLAGPQEFPQVSAGDLLSQDKYRYLTGQPNINSVIPPSQISKPLRQQDLPNVSRSTVDITPIDQRGLPTREYQAPKPSIKQDRPLPERQPAKADSRSHMEQLAALRKSVPTMTESPVKTRTVNVAKAVEELKAKRAAESKPAEVKPVESVVTEPKPQINRTPDKIKDTVVEPPKAALSFEEAQQAVRSKLPEVKRWLDDPEKSKVDIERVKDEINEAVSQFDPKNPIHAEELAAVDQMMSVINRKQQPNIDFFGESYDALAEAVVKPDRPLPETSTVDPNAMLQITTQQRPKVSMTPEEVKSFLQEQDINWRLKKQSERVKELGKEEPKPKKKKPKSEAELQREYERILEKEGLGELDNKPIEYDAEIANYGGREMANDFAELFFDERGSLSTKDLSPARKAALQRITKKLKQEGKDVAEYLRALGLNQEAITALAESSREVQRQGQELKKVYQPWSDKPETVIKHRKRKRGNVMFPEVTVGDANMMFEAKELPKTFAFDLREKFRNPIRTFEKIGGGLKEAIYDKYSEAETRIARRVRQERNERFQLEKSLSRKERQRISDYWISMQEGGGNKQRGREVLEAMGVKEIPTLTEKEMAAYRKLQSLFDESLKRTNEMRVQNGKSPIKGIDNYLSFMRTFNLMEELGLESNPIHTNMGRIRSAYAQVGDKPVSFAKLRGKTGAYPIERDAFVVMDRYMESATRHQELSPIIAKIKELRRGIKDENGQTFLLKNEKPMVDKFLREWANHIGDMSEPGTFQTLKKVTSKLSKNLVVSMLGYNLRSAAIQASALRNTYTEIGAFHTLHGLYSNMLPKSRAHAIYKSNHLDARAMDVELAQIATRIRAGNDVVKIVGEFGMEPLKWLDKETARSTWLGAYEYGGKVLKIRDEKARIAYADDVVVKTQASGLKGDIAPIQRTAVGKFVTLLQTFTINDWGYLINDVIGAKNLSTKAKMAKVLRYVFATALISAFYEDVLGIKSPFPTPVRAIRQGLEDDDSFLAIAADVGKELIEPIPVLGSTRYGGTALGAGVQLIGDVSKGERLPENLAKAAGVPGTGQVGKSVRAASRGGKVQGMLPQSLPEPAGELYRVMMGQYDPRKKKSKRKKRGYKGY